MKRVLLLGIFAVVAVFFVMMGGAGQAQAQGAQVSTNPLDAIGSIDAPPGVEEYNTRAKAETGADIAIIYFISTLIIVFSVIMGVWVMFNFIIAGYTYLNSSGDAGAHDKVRQNITQSVVGLILIVMAYTITGLISLIFFGDAAFLLNPVLPRY